MKLETQMQIGKNLRVLRTSNSLSQSEVAAFAGVSRSLYAGYELGNRTPDAEVLFAISRRFGINMSVLFESDPYRFLSQMAGSEVYDDELIKLISNYKALSPFAKGMLIERASWLAEWDKVLQANKKAIEDRINAL